MDNHNTTSMSSPESTFLEKAVAVGFTLFTMVWVNVTNTEGAIFKVVVAPIVGGTIAYFTAKFWKWIFKEKS